MDVDDKFRQIQQHAFGGEMAISMGWVVMLVGLVIVLVSALSLRHWWRTRHERATPILSFVTLAGKLGLTAADQWVLIRVSNKLKLPTPITLLVSRGTLRHHGRAYADGMPKRRSAKLMKRLDTIADKLFPAEGARA